MAEPTQKAPAYRPAEWKYNADELIVVDGTGRIVVDVCRGGSPENIIRTNGYLIAAAPTLRDACQAAFDTLGREIRRLGSVGYSPLTQVS